MKKENNKIENNEKSNSNSLKRSSYSLIIVASITLFMMLVFFSYSLFGGGKGTYSALSDFWSCPSGNNNAFIISNDKESALCCSSGFNEIKNVALLNGGTGDYPDDGMDGKNYTCVNSLFSIENYLGMVESKIYGFNSPAYLNYGFCKSNNEQYSDYGSCNAAGGVWISDGDDNEFSLTNEKNICGFVCAHDPEDAEKVSPEAVSYVLTLDANGDGAKLSSSDSEMNNFLHNSSTINIQAYSPLVTCNSTSCSADVSKIQASKDGFKFKGWRSDRSSCATSSTNTITYSSDITYIACFDPISTDDDSGSDTGTDGGEGCYSYDNPNLGVTRTSWANSKNDAKLKLDATNVNDIIFTGDTKDNCGCKVVFNAGDGSFESGKFLKAAAELNNGGVSWHIKYPTEKPTRDDYDFIGYKTDSIGCNSAVGNGTQTSGDFSTCTNFTACWKPKSTGGGGETPKSCTYKISLPSGASYANGYNGEEKEYTGQINLNTSDGLKKYVTAPSGKCFNNKWDVVDKDGNAIPNSPYESYISQDEGDCGITLTPQFTTCSSNGGSGSGGGNGGGTGNDPTPSSSSSSSSSSDAEYEKLNPAYDRCYNNKWVRVVSCQPDGTGAKCKLSTGETVDKATIKKVKTTGCDVPGDAFDASITEGDRCNTATGKLVYIVSCQPFSDVIGAHCKDKDGNYIFMGNLGAKENSACKNDKPSTDNSDDPANQDVDSSAPTGTTAFVLSMIAAIIALGISFYYFRKNYFVKQ